MTQEFANDWLARYHDQKFRKYLDKFSVSSKFIEKKAVYAPGIVNQELEQNLYAIAETEKPDMHKKSFYAQKIIKSIFEDLYPEDGDVPDFINHVSCTHYESPSAAQLTAVAKDWCEKTTVTHLYHMGCYASMPALRVACAYIANGATHVDTVHTELCSFHLDKDSTTPEQIIMKTLFADGAIKYSYLNEAKFMSAHCDGFEVLSQYEVLVPESDKEMSWKIGTHGFVMNLSRKVPSFLAAGIEKFMIELFSKAGLDYHEMKNEVVFAVHPGGPRIIDVVAEVLELTTDQVKHSHYILKNRGNMSSATIPFVWNEILNDKTIKNNTLVASVAFGPGLTMTGSILKICRV